MQDSLINIGVNQNSLFSYEKFKKIKTQLKMLCNALNYNSVLNYILTSYITLL